MAVGNGPEGGGLVGEAAAFGAGADEEEDEEEDEEGEGSEDEKSSQEDSSSDGEGADDKDDEAMEDESEVEEEEPKKKKAKGESKKSKGKIVKKGKKSKVVGGKGDQGAGTKAAAPSGDKIPVASGESGGAEESMTGSEPGFQQPVDMDTTDPKVKVLEDLSWLTTGVPNRLEEVVYCFSETFSYPTGCLCATQISEGQHFTGPRGGAQGELPLDSARIQLSISMWLSQAFGPPRFQADVAYLLSISARGTCTHTSPMQQLHFLHSSHVIRVGLMPVLCLLVVRTGRAAECGRDGGRRAARALHRHG